jgi:ATP-binding cassette subfamily C protein
MTLTMSGILIAGIMEGFSIMALLPLVAGIIDSTSTSKSAISQFVEELFISVSISPTIENLLIFIVIAIILKSLFVYFAITNAGYTSSAIITNLRKEIVTNILRTEYSLFPGQKSGDMTAMMIHETQKSGVACMEAVKMLARAIEIAVYLIIAVLISWKVTLGAILVGVFGMLLMTRIIRRSRKIGHQQNVGIRSLSSNLIDGLGIIKAIKAMGREKLLAKFLIKEVDELQRLQRARVRNDELFRNIQEPVRVIAAAICLYFIANIWVDGFESLLVLMYLFIRTVGYFGTFQQHYHSLVKFEPAFWSVRDTAEHMLSLREPKTGNYKPGLNSGIEFKNVSFNYDQKTVLHNLSVYFPAHRFIAVSGPSGAGKTTLIDMLSGLLKPLDGEILIDSHPLDDCDIKFWRQKIGYVPQEMFLLHDTIQNNITFGDLELGEKDVEYALTRAGAMDFVSATPEGMKTIVGERGAKLSGGQRQRIAIARALVRRPELLILDEVTASLDKKTELEICQTLNNLTSETTIIAISHQQTMLEMADMAFRMEHGKLIPLTNQSTQGVYLNANQ